MELIESWLFGAAPDKVITYVVAGCGHVGSVTLNSAKRVGGLRDAMIKNEHFLSDPRAFKLYKAKRSDGTWLRELNAGIKYMKKEGRIPEQVRKMMSADNSMDISHRVDDARYAFPDSGKECEEDVHVILDVPRRAKFVFRAIACAQNARDVARLREIVCTGETFFMAIAVGCLGYAAIEEVPSIHGDSILTMGTLKAWIGDCLEYHQTVSAIGCISFGLGVVASKSLCLPEVVPSTLGEGGHEGRDQCESLSIFFYRHFGSNTGQTFYTSSNQTFELGGSSRKIKQVVSSLSLI